jgi:hypothetical protein
MMDRRWAFSCALVLAAASIVACGDDTTNVTPTPVGDGGPDGTASDAATTQDVGADSPNDVGEPGADAADASVADAGADATLPDDAAPDGGTADDGGAGSDADGGKAKDAAAATDANDAGPAGYAIFVGTDLISNAELSVVALNPDGPAGNLVLADEDSIAYGSSGLGFVLERGLGTVLALAPDAPATVSETIDVNDTADAAAYASNPHAVIVTTGTKAYVARYASNTAAIVDLGSGTKTGTIDLSAFLAPDDPDGLIEVSDGAYDPVANRAYFLLQRINEFATYQAPDYVPACLTSHPEIVAIDPTTNAVVPLTDAGNGAIDLLGDNPETLVADFANGRLLVSEGGCYGMPDGGDGAARFGRGVESITLASATPAWLYQTSDVNLVSGLVLVDSTHAYLEVGSQWFPWDPTQTTLGTTAVANFPLAPVYDGAGRIVGLWQTKPDAGSDAGVSWSVVAMSTATQNLSTLVTAPFKSVSPDPGYGLTSALLR